MATTPTGLPYPVGTDKVVDGDDAIQALALALDVRLSVRAGERSATTSAGGDVALTFATPFTSVCTMIAPVDRTTGAGAGAIIWKVISMTTTGGVVRAYPGTGTTPIANSPVAVGYVAAGF